jgi:hypothetical protein
MPDPYLEREAHAHARFETAPKPAASRPHVSCAGRHFTERSQLPMVALMMQGWPCLWHLLLPTQQLFWTPASPCLLAQATDN